MKTGYINTFLTCCIAMLLNTEVKGQDSDIFTNILSTTDSITKTENALVFNMRTFSTTHTDSSGIFCIPSSIGDTLEISCEDYLNNTIQLKNFKKPIIVLNEVIITGKRTKPNTEEISSEYRKANSIYYNGKPPLTLLSPFGGKPITFFRELFGKSAKRVRKFDNLMTQESKNNEIDTWFNSRIIRRVIPIMEEEIETFKASYRPRFEDLKQWSEYDLYEYIKESFKKFKSTK